MNCRESLPNSELRRTINLLRFARSDVHPNHDTDVGLLGAPSPGTRGESARRAPCSTVQATRGPAARSCGGQIEKFARAVPNGQECLGLGRGRHRPEHRRLLHQRRHLRPRRPGDRQYRRLHRRPPPRRQLRLRRPVCPVLWPLSIELSAAQRQSGQVLERSGGLSMIAAERSHKRRRCTARNTVRCSRVAGRLRSRTGRASSSSASGFPVSGESQAFMKAHWF